MANIAEVMSTDDNVEEIVQAASKHDDALLERLLMQYTFPEVDAVDVQNARGTSPLHAAIASCVPTSTNGHAGESTVSPSSELEQMGCDTVRLLLENGAIWNQLDNNGDTPGCIASRHGLLDLYELMVDAGVRAEILLNRLEGYEHLEDEIEVEPVVEMDDLAAHTADVSRKDMENDGAPQLLDATQATTTTDTIEVNSSDYLASSLTFDRNKLLDNDKNGVMMAWESDIMKSASKWAVRGFTQVFAMEMAQHKINVNAYAPGIVGTAMWDLIDEKLGEQQGQQKGESVKKYSSELTAMGRVSTPDDVARVVGGFLCGKDSLFVTGQTIVVDGGIIFT
ncbi:hypothetical protein LTR66_017094 [Elasticomyces elasticus]|nr:hypothetical protein LTR66_017094 [Elasticomyces elasticus]